MKTLETIQNELRDLVAQGIDLTLAALKKLLVPGTDCHNDLILLEGRYQDVSRQLLQGIVANEDATLAFNKIRKDLLDFINHLKQSDLLGLAPETTDGALPDVYNGEVLYRIPKKMKLGVESECIIRLAFDRKILLHDFEVHVGDVVKDLRISDVMGVELLDPNADKAFAITTLTDMVQFVEKDLMTEWIFYVKPLRAGEFPLVLKISIIEIINGIERKRNEVLKEQVQIVTELPAEAASDFISTGYSWQLTNSEEQRAVPGAPRVVEPGNVPPSAPRPAAPRPSPGPQPGNTSKAVGLALLGKVLAGVAVLVIGGVALTPFLFNNNSAEKNVAVDDSPAARLRQLRNNANRQELEEFLRENPGTAEASTAMMVLDSLENAAWQSAVASNEYDSIKQYLNEYPTGRHVDEAAVRMDEMNRGEVVVVDSVKVDNLVVEDNVKEEISKTPKFNPKATAPKPSPPKRNPPTQRPSKPPTTPTKPPVTKPREPAPTKPETEVVDPNKPVALVSAARRPVFRKCSSSNKEKEAKCTEEKIYWYLKSRLEYPQAALRNSIEGRVVVSFVVERDGSITEVKALNDIGGDCAKEAVRLVKQLPKFKPGLNGRGEPIRVLYTQSILFSLQ